MMGVRVIGADAASASFAASAATIGPKTTALRNTYAARLAAMVQSRAPRRTGAYAASIGVDSDGNVGTNHPAAGRLEFGFHGVDSLGRRYNQSPQAHYGPAADVVTAPFMAAAEALVDTL